jgi:predicted kinase
MPTLHFLQGLPASGKSTFAKQLAAETSAIIVSKDILREHFLTGKWTGKKEKEILKIAREQVEALLEANVSVIVDDTNFNPIHETFYRDLAKKYNAEFIKHVMETDVEECIKRNAERDNPVPKDVIVQMYEKYVCIPLVNTMPTSNSVVIVDIDGTLSLMCDRSPYDYTRVNEDRARQSLRHILFALRTKVVSQVIVFTGRDEACRQETTDWLDNNGIVYDALFMRADNDKRRDSIVKEEMLHQHILSQGLNVAMVFDDRPQVVRMWRKYGFCVYSLALGYEY